MGRKLGLVPPGDCGKFLDTPCLSFPICEVRRVRTLFRGMAVSPDEVMPVGGQRTARWARAIC